MSKILFGKYLVYIILNYYVFFMLCFLMFTIEVHF